MTEMVALNMGQYAHGNQPIQHMTYPYVHAGQPWKTQQRVRQILSQLYDSSPQGYCGDEDNGQTSAWYVFGALRFYPVTPGRTTYILGSPLFDRATIHLPNDKVFAIEATDNDSDHVYVESTTLDGAPLNHAWLDHAEIVRGGILRLKMSAHPNKERASAIDSLPSE